MNATFTYPTTRDLATAAIFLEMERNRRHDEAFYDDPMTDACGCVGDFAEDFDRRDRKLAGKLYDRAKRTGEAEVFAFACDLFERWMP